jgi:putative Holliday junction resolvase
VIGLPLLLSGDEGTAARSAREFAERLSRRLPGLSVELWDERLTTVEVERMLIAADVRRKKRKQVVDKLAAVLILQGYLDAHDVAGPQTP